MSQIVLPDTRTTGGATLTMTASDLNGAVGFSSTCTYTCLAGIPVGTRVVLYATTDGVGLTVVAGGADSILGTATATLNTGEGRTLIRETATAWRLVQLGSVTANSVRIVITGGAIFAQAGTLLGETFTATGPATSPTSTGDPNSVGATLSGANLTIPAATASTGNFDSNAQRWSWQLSSLGVVIPASTRMIRQIVRVSSFTDGARTPSSLTYVGVSAGTAAATNLRSMGFLRPSSGGSWNIYQNSGSTATFNTATGSAGAVKLEGVSLVGDTLSPNFLVYRYISDTDPDATATIASIGSVATTIPTWMSVYAQVTTANTLASWTLNDFQVYLAW